MLDPSRGSIQTIASSGGRRRWDTAVPAMPGLPAVHPPPRRSAEVPVGKCSVGGVRELAWWTPSPHHQAWYPGLEVPFVIARVAIDGARASTSPPTFQLSCDEVDSATRPGDLPAEGEIYLPLFGRWPEMRGEAYILGRAVAGRTKADSPPFAADAGCVKEALPTGLTIDQIDGIGTFPGRSAGYLGFAGRLRRTGGCLG